MTDVSFLCGFTVTNRHRICEPRTNKNRPVLESIVLFVSNLLRFAEMEMERMLFFVVASDCDDSFTRNDLVVCHVVEPKFSTHTFLPIAFENFSFRIFF